MMGNAKAKQPSRYHYQPDPAASQTLLCGAPVVSAPWYWGEPDYSGPEPTGVTSIKGDVTCPDCLSKLGRG